MTMTPLALVAIVIVGFIMVWVVALFLFGGWEEDG